MQFKRDSIYAFKRLFRLTLRKFLALNPMQKQTRRI